MAEESVCLFDLPVFNETADIGGADDASVQRDGRNDIAAQPMLSAVGPQFFGCSLAFISEAVPRPL